MNKKARFNHRAFFFENMAPAVGFEPTTKWLTATYSTIELRRIYYENEQST